MNTYLIVSIGNFIGNILLFWIISSRLSEIAMLGFSRHWFKISFSFSLNLERFQSFFVPKKINKSFDYYTIISFLLLYVYSYSKNFWYKLILTDGRY